MTLSAKNKTENILEFTKDELAEYVKCKKSYKYFVTHYVYVRDKNGKIVKFKPWPKQLKLINALQDHKWILTAAARQIGKCQNIDTQLTIRRQTTSKIKRIISKLYQFLTQRHINTYKINSKEK